MLHTCDGRVEMIAKGQHQDLHPPLIQPSGPLPLVVVEQPPPPVPVGRILPVWGNSFAEHGIGLTSWQLASEFNLDKMFCNGNIGSSWKWIVSSPDCSSAKNLRW